MHYPAAINSGRGITLQESRKTINEAQLLARREQIATEAADIDRLIGQAVATKSYGQLADLEGRVDRLAEQREEQDAAEARFKAAAQHPLNPFGAASAADEQGVPVDTKAMRTGRGVSPLMFSEASLKGLHAAAASKQSLSVKAFSTVDSLLPAQLAPAVLGQVHENRLLDRLPATPISAPSYEFIRHNSSTGSPGVTAEGGLKPDVVLNTTAVIVSAAKLAATFGLSHETLMDWSSFTTYAQTEMIRQVCDLENSQLLNGSGTGGNMLGLNLTTGALTHALTTETGLDAIELAITQLRTGSSLAEANLLVLNPSTWSALRRSKDSQGRYLVNPDPTAADGQRIWDVDVLVTTTQAAGAGLLLDTNKFGKVLVREGITVATGTTNDDFSRNITRFVVETRLALAVERPTAVLTITNLPTA
jgi:HK97 family phage major capsid protein